MRWGLLTTARCMAADDGGAGGSAPPIAIVEPAAVDPQAPATLAPEPPPAATEAPAEPDPTPKPDKVERRIANLTRKMADEARLREAAERRADAAEALVSAGRTEATPATPATDIEARAAQIVAEREFNRRLTEIDASGKKEIGAEAWEQAKATLGSLGAVNNQAFLQALAEAENPAKIFAHFADDTDALMDLLKKSPAAMAAKMGRMDADMSKPVVRALSAAPTPPARVVPSGVVPEPSPYSYPPGMSMKEWSKMMDNVLPPSLGGKRKAG